MDVNPGISGAKHGVKGFLRRLREDASGNTMIFMAGAVVPLLGLIGGAVDLSRMSMAKSRLQMACDAGALATRREMTSLSPTTANIAVGTGIFNFNYPATAYNSTGTTVNYGPRLDNNGLPTGDVDGRASAVIPSTVTRIMSHQGFTVRANCSSRLDVGNVDVVLVLDTTGSMLDNIPAGDTNGDGLFNGSDTQETKIAALRNAVDEFFGVLGGGDAGGHSSPNGVIRYGVVPYSSSVNVGYLLPTSALVGGTSGESWTYPTRKGIYSRTCYYRFGLSTCYSSSSNANSASTSSTLTGRQCNNWGRFNASGPSYPASGTNPFVSGAMTTSYSYDSYNGSTSTSTSTNLRKCVRKATETSDSSFSGATFGFIYGNYPVNVSQFVGGAAAPNPAYHAAGPATETARYSGTDYTYSQPSTLTWSGCIEERDTNDTITGSTSTSEASIPSDAFDLDIDLDPTTTETRWRPLIQQIVYDQDLSASPIRTYPFIVASSTAAIGGGWCPRQARKLAVYPTYDSNPNYGPNSSAPRVLDSSSSLEDYIDDLEPGGGTYHDIGMIWGVRMLSPNGPFASENVNPSNGKPISRHIVFMTDGIMSTSGNNYTSYGINDKNGMLAPTGTGSSTLNDIHNIRFEMVCNRAKAMGITVWVVTLGSPLNTPLQNCATSSTTHARQANSSDDIEDIFSTIARQLAGLRLSS